ncbi:hypothetical protein [Acidithiobacillus sulfurivorans]|uniref:DUF4402 domain-containing protein n=1 Tax=Acidithiobacillus sulfurivorans TaxID=1958756 RepID=A0ABS5ZTY4_9PROT|nr:hypothetical protein [Acidithiobacillus sulfurivorans]MBU2758657.1 hypothetical protein [Acidithiobacillus sulfurivorans]
MQKLIALMILMFPAMAMAATHAEPAPSHMKPTAMVQKVTVPAEKQNIYDIKVLQNGKLVAKNVVSVLPGHVSPFSDGVQHTFVSSSFTNATGVTKLIPGTYTTGITGSIKRSFKHPDVIRFNSSESTLAAMHTMRGVQLPRMNIETFDQSMSMVPGEKLKLSGYSKSGGATVVMITHK